MRWILLCLLCIPFVYADTSATFWQYDGDTWEHDGVLYSIEGNDPDRLLFGVDGQFFVINLYDCATRGIREYCYLDTGYPDDESHIKYEAGEQLFAYNVEVKTHEPSLSVTRTLSEDEPAVGEETELTVTITNEGDYTVRDLVYTEDIPAGLVLRSGPRQGNDVHFTADVLPLHQVEKFTYRVRPDIYGEYTLDPLLQYMFEGKTFNLSVSTKTIEVSSPIDVEQAFTANLNLEESGFYMVNVTNDEKQDLDLTVAITMPEGLLVTDTDDIIEKDSIYVATATLEEDEKASHTIFFTSTKEGTMSLHLDVTTVVDGAEFTHKYDNTVTVKSDKLSPSITISPKREKYFSGTSITVNGVLENVNTELSYKSVKGYLRGPFTTVPFNDDSILPEETMTAAKSVFLTKEVNETTTFPITFAGSYKSAGGRRFTFETESSITVEPFVHFVAVEQKIDPPQPKSGENVTVTVAVKNIYDTYITVDVHEKYPGELVKTSGLTYGTTSLERDAQEQMYIYKLEIPSDYAEDRFTITTSVLVKDQTVPELFHTEVLLAGAENVEEAPVQEEQAPVQEPQEDKKELGFFASIWDFFKGFFS